MDINKPPPVIPPRVLELATNIAAAVGLDEVSEGCDVSAGLIGTYLSTVLHETAHRLDERDELLAFLKRLAGAGEWFRGALEFNTLLHDGEDLEREMLTLIAAVEGGAA